MTWAEVVVAFLTVLPATLAAVGALIVSLRGNKKVEEVGKAVDGRLEQLMAARTDAATQRGFVAGSASERKPEEG